MQHEMLIQYLEEEAAKRHMSLAELAEAMGMNPSMLYNIRSGKQPGLKVCSAIAKYTGRPIDEILYLAGHITEEEIQSMGDIPPSVLSIARRIGNATPEQREKLIKVLNAYLEAEGL